MNLENNIWDIQDNLILRHDGSVSAIYRIPSKVINTVDSRSKEEFKRLVNYALSGLRPYHDFEIAMIPMDKDLLAQYQKLALDIDEETSDLAEYILNGTLERLANSIGVLYEYQFFIVVPLKSLNISMDLKTVLHQSYREVRNKTLSLVGLEEAVPENWADKYRHQKEVLENVLSMLDARALTRQETIFINRLQYLRGQFFDKDFEILQVESSMDNLDDVNLSFEDINIIKLNNGDESSYLALLPVDKLSENVSYLHLLETIQTLRFPVEANFKCQFSLPNGIFSILNKARRARKRLNNVIEEAAESNDVQKGSVVRSQYLLEDAQVKFDEDEPMVNYLNTLMITAQSLEELKSKYELLYAQVASVGAGLVRANADQIYLFYKTRLTEILESKDKNFIQSMSLEAFCENMLFVSKKVGTDNGFYIGRVDHQTDSWSGDFKSAIESSSNTVFTNLLQANKLGVRDKKTSNPHVAIIGETGSGKSFLTKLLFTYHSLLKTKILYIDPKAEMRSQYQKVLEDYRKQGKYDEIQSYIQSINFVTLNAKDKSNHGALDPIVFLEGQEARDLADSMIDMLLGKDNSIAIKNAYFKSIDRCLERRQSGETVGMIHVFEDMMAHEEKEIREVGDYLMTVVSDSLLSLCFSDGSHPGIDINSKITILEVTGLNLPSDKTATELTSDEKKSSAVMYALGYFCASFGERDRTVETISFVDEAWFLNATAIGRKILSRMKRVGRSFNNFLVLITQSVKDLRSEEDGTGFGTVFAFYESSEVDEVLDYLKIPKTKTTREWYQNMTMGQCIYFDTFGRKERITVDGIFPEINELFKTVESNLKAVA